MRRPANDIHDERRSRGPAFVILSALLAAVVLPAAVDALVDIDFEQKYFVLPGREIWDFCLVRDDAGITHVFYIDREAGGSNPPVEQLGHASSTDLVHWTVHAPAITIGPGWWEGSQVWAPHVVRDTVEDRWVMAYTGVDSLKVQRPCVAYSDDLFTWTKSTANPLFEPDTLVYFWSPTEEWSSFRDPYLYFEDGAWQMLTTAARRIGGYPGYKRGVLHRASSTDFETWTDHGVFFEHDGDVKTHDLESAHYVVRDGKHHLLFTEYNVPGLSHIPADSVGGFTMANRRILETSSAPEILPVDGGDVLGRYCTYQHPSSGIWSFVLRFDTLSWDPPDIITIVKPDPWAQDWNVVSGTSTLGNPVYRDNPGERGEPATGFMGNFWFGSQEYFRGPQGEVGAPGAVLGTFAQGILETAPFIVEGVHMTLLVGGGDYPASCYVALVDAATDEILLSETGDGTGLMTLRDWDLRWLQGREVVLRIADQETGPLGYINVDEILESHVDTAVGPAPPAPVRAVAAPNPFNPRTEFRFALAGAADTRIDVHDLRGRRVWSSTTRRLEAGPRAIAWDGRDADGRDLPSGAYVFRLRLDGRTAATGRLALVR